LRALAVTNPGLFAEPELARFGSGQQRTADSLVATIATHSAVLLMGEGEREPFLASVRAYLRSRPETRGGEFLLPLLTVAARARRAG
jgi:hypothetical protein